MFSIRTITFHINKVYRSGHRYPQWNSLKSNRNGWRIVALGAAAASLIMVMCVKPLSSMHLLDQCKRLMDDWQSNIIIRNESPSTAHEGNLDTHKTFDEITIPGDITLFSPHVQKLEDEILERKQDNESQPQFHDDKGSIRDSVPLVPLPSPTHDFQMIDAEGISLMIPVSNENYTSTKEYETEDTKIERNPNTGEINWDAPTLGGLANGQCGNEFKLAFSCFVHSQTTPKGVDCIKSFNRMQDCFTNNIRG
ncbi:similar to Saccharomyces cerevisiae YKL195W MIA40 Essential protein of the mitochondrial intermembrane space (IMS) [Maudiozyma saulgeensis]|uniref:Mitochondrial intermembrane space import and assembly protein 40 n=1 Tax=Maudiozyma saulgeensis TaxID=1789683 RepID=A0A1X7QZ59_9SACH|nr:similar to Saccharomyces cerevisiae YKL195W MIA40 Essential protein of the mitochondrial intermembrane space (IMS) [Kazachstania saulgeensis]